jgi:hypothetical protein
MMCLCRSVARFNTEKKCPGLMGLARVLTPYPPLLRRPASLPPTTGAAAASYSCTSCSRSHSHVHWRWCLSPALTISTESFKPCASSSTRRGNRYGKDLGMRYSSSSTSLLDAPVHRSSSINQDVTSTYRF